MAKTTTDPVLLAAMLGEMQALCSAEPFVRDEATIDGGVPSRIHPEDRTSYAAAPEVSAASAARSAAAQVVGRVLVVDDEPEIAGLVAAALGEDGHRVEQVADGREALARIARGGIDLVISDLRMPGMDGAALLRELRRADSPLAGSAVLLTGDVLGAGGHPGLGGDEGVALMEKPVDLDELRRLVVARLSREGAVS